MVDARSLGEIEVHRDRIATTARPAHGHGLLEMLLCMGVRYRHMT
jgi:hypothetical protein